MKDPRGSVLFLITMTGVVVLKHFISSRLQFSCFIAVYPSALCWDFLKFDSIKLGTRLFFFFHKKWDARSSKQVYKPFIQHNYEELSLAIGCLCQLQAIQHWLIITVHRVGFHYVQYDAVMPLDPLDNSPPHRISLPEWRMPNPCGCSVLCGPWRWPVTPYPFPASNLVHEWRRLHSPLAVAMETVSLTWNATV